VSEGTAGPPVAHNPKTNASTVAEGAIGRMSARDHEADAEDTVLPEAAVLMIEESRRKPVEEEDPALPEALDQAVPDLPDLGLRDLDLLIKRRHLEETGTETPKNPKMVPVLDTSQLRRRKKSPVKEGRGVLDLTLKTDRLKTETESHLHTLPKSQLEEPKFPKNLV